MAVGCGKFDLFSATFDSKRTRARAVSPASYRSGEKPRVAIVDPQPRALVLRPRDAGDVGRGVGAWDRDHGPLGAARARSRAIWSRTRAGAGATGGCGADQRSAVCVAVDGPGPQGA